MCCWGGTLASPSPARSSGYKLFAGNTERVSTADPSPSLVIVGLVNLQQQVTNNFHGLLN